MVRQEHCRQLCDAVAQCLKRGRRRAEPDMTECNPAGQDQDTGHTGDTHPLFRPMRLPHPACTVFPADMVQRVLSRYDRSPALQATALTCTSFQLFAHRLTPSDDPFDRGMETFWKTSDGFPTSCLVNTDQRPAPESRTMWSGSVTPWIGRCQNGSAETLARQSELWRSDRARCGRYRAVATRPDRRQG